MSKKRDTIVISIAGGIAIFLTLVFLVLFICVVIMGQKQMLLVSIGCICFAICLYAISIAKFIFIAIDMLHEAISDVPEEQ